MSRDRAVGYQRLIIMLIQSLRPVLSQECTCCNRVMTTNPSHILIARNSRKQNPSTALTIPTEPHAGASGVFRSSTGSPPWLLEECETDDIVSDCSSDDDEEPIEIEETFTMRSSLPGKVKIIVESTTFWCVVHTNYETTS